MLGKKYGYYPEDIEQAYMVESFYDSLADITHKFIEVKFETDEEKKKQKAGDLLTIHIPKYFDIINKRLEQNKS